MGIGGSKKKKKKDNASNQKTDPAVSSPPSRQKGIVAGRNYKLVVLGDAGVGKTAVTIRFVQDMFVADYDPTVEDAYKKEYSFESKDIVLELVDTAGQEEYSSGFHDKFIRAGEGFLCVYSITSKEGFKKMTEIKEKIGWTKDMDSVPMVLIGNKCDLAKERAVSVQEGKDLAASFNCPFLETSAKTGTNINETFNALLSEIARLGPA